MRISELHTIFLFAIRLINLHMVATLLVGIVLLAASFAASASVRSFLVSFGTAFVLGMLVCLLDSKTKGIADLFKPGMLVVSLFFAVVFHGLVSVVRLVRMGTAYRYAILLVCAVVFPILMFLKMGKQIEATNIIINVVVFSLMITIIYFVSSRIQIGKSGNAATN